MNKFLKKLSVFLMVTTMAFSAVGCGAKDAEVTETPAATEAPEAEATEAPEAEATEAPEAEAPTTDAASDEDYKAKVEEIYGNIAATSSEIMAAVDQTDLEKTVEAMTTLVTTVKPMYEELAALVAPETFIDAQAQIKTGAEASIELLNLSLELMALEGESEEVAEAKAAELQEKMVEFQASAQELVTGMNTVLGDSTAE